MFSEDFGKFLMTLTVKGHFVMNLWSISDAFDCDEYLRVCEIVSLAVVIT